ncbi:hypothetical protein SAMN05444279_103150 [Ruegeria intermedia]|uniref:YHS domain-containing protein n=1 Tax=Ruegeria intermedia TaxID=996115 RepID=A0A1M4U3P1_9RHOB|nr:YHS domain-containing (seleno)protein [Ruegeria intermedia]SHE51157.1 hypothetical protein SAMN05444279_103150 [Ruegeria intermedia]
MLMLTRRSVLAGVGLSALAPSVLWAQKRAVFFATENGAMSGFDAVAYFRGGRPMRGRPDVMVMWKGAAWHFVSQEHREAFERNPRAFAPRFGGYCAFAMAHGQLSSADPTAWKIVDGRLYLTHSPVVEKIWEANMADYIRKAEVNWPDVLYR